MEDSALPHDLFIWIIAILDKDALYNLCLTSRWMYTAAAPELYRTYEQPRYRRQSRPWFRSPLVFNVDPSSHVKYHSIIPFMRTLISRPDLAACVKELKIHEWGVMMIEEFTGKWEDWKQTQDVSLQELYGQACKYVYRVRQYRMAVASERIQHKRGQAKRLLLYDDDDDYSEEQKRDIFSFDHANDLALLLLLVPNLRTLFLQLPPYNNWCVEGLETLVACIRKYGAHGTGRPFLEKLETLRLDRSNSGHVTSYQILTSLLSLPSLRNLYGHWYSDYISFGLHDRDLTRPRASNIRHINLMCCRPYLSSFRSIFKYCVMLQTFRVNIALTKSITIDSDRIQQIAAALPALALQVAHSLEAFALVFSQHMRRSRRLVTPLRRLEKLRHLDMPQNTLMLVPTKSELYQGRFPYLLYEILPRSIETLKIRDADLVTMHSLMDLLEFRLREFPLLREIAVIRDSPDSDLVDSSSLAHGFKEAGIAFNTSDLVHHTDHEMFDDFIHN